jgi:hypothetical protein
MAQILINRINITNKVHGALTKKRFQGLAYNAAKLRHDVAGFQALAVFDSHPITIDLKQGATSTDSLLDYGNFAAYLGLSDSNASVDKLRQDLEAGFNRMNKTPLFTKYKDHVTYEFKVKAPTLQEIYDKNPPPKDSYGISWVQAVEKGLNNFAYFVFRLLGLPKSRSGTGLQRETLRKWPGAPKISKSSPKIKWVSEVINKFLSYFNKR